MRHGPSGLAIPYANLAATIVTTRAFVESRAAMLEKYTDLDVLTQPAGTKVFNFDPEVYFELGLKKRPIPKANLKDLPGIRDAADTKGPKGRSPTTGKKKSAGKGGGGLLLAGAAGLALLGASQKRP